MSGVVTSTGSACGGGSPALSSVTGSAAQATGTETAAGNNYTFAGVETAALTYPFVFTDANSTGNNTSGALIVNTTGTSTAARPLLINEATAAGNFITAISGGTVTNGVESGGTTEFQVSNTGQTLMGASAPTITFGTAGGSVAVEGTAFTGISGSDGWYADSTTHSMEVINGTTNQGSILSTGHNGTHNFATAAQSQVTVAGTSYYITSSNLATPSVTYQGYVVGTTWKWRIAGLTKNANGTGLTSFIIFSGTNGTTADTAEVTQAWGSAAATAAIDVAEVDVLATITNITTGTATVYWTINPEHHLATTGWAGSTISGGYSGTFTFSTGTSGLIFGLGINIATGATNPTITIPYVVADSNIN